MFKFSLVFLTISFSLYSHLYAQSEPDQVSSHFPSACILDVSETEHPLTHKKFKKKLLKAHFKYPYIRTEEQLDATAHKEEIAMVADHVLVTLAPHETPQHFLEQLHFSGAYLERVAVKAPLYRLKLGPPSLETVPKILSDITSKHLAVTHSEPDYICAKTDLDPSPLLPNDPYYGFQYNLWKSWTLLETGSSFPGITFTSGIDAERAWGIQHTAASIIVAILDSGIRYTHEDLADNMWHNPMPVAGDLYGTNTVNNNCNPMDNEGHGTHCAGIIGAVGGNGLGITGVAWKVQLMACKFLDSSGMGTISDEVAAIEYACDHGARVLNCSFGTIIPSTIERAALEEARKRQIIVVAAAGNHHANNDDRGNFFNFPFYPAAYDLDNIVSVTSSSLFNGLSNFSNYGQKSVHLAAPGEEIYSTWFTSDNAYHTDSGTSMAAPQVTGALALMMEKFPDLSYQQLIAHLLYTTDKVPELKGKTVSGGRLNLYQALKCNPENDLF